MPSSNKKHIPVLTKEVCFGLPKPDRFKLTIVDCTFGYGGHYLAIKAHLGELLDAYYGIEQDISTLEEVKDTFSAEKNLHLIFGNFRKLDLLIPSGLKPHVVLFDLGTSTPQLTGDEKGLSLYKDAPLDMRLNPSFQKKTAVDVLKTIDKHELEAALEAFANVRKFKTLAKQLKAFALDKKTPKTTFGLLETLKPYLPRPSRGKVHPATTIFQCLRILVNDEMAAIEEGLKRSIEVLHPKGRLLVISFHSTEHRLVKQVLQSQLPYGKILTKKPIKPDAMEIKNNPASRSSQLRIFEKTA